MLGLGLSITKVSGLRSLASKLLGILRSRSTYSENNVSSNAIIDAIDNVGVLDDATILLTPTAYSDARVHSVKTYTGDDYVVGGDFSDFSNDWSTNTATESNGVVTIPDGGYIFQSISFPNDGTVRIRVEGSGTVKYRLGVSSPSDTFITKTLPFTAYEDLNSTDTRMQLNNTSGSDITVTSVSVINVSSDFDFDRASSATRINSDGLVQDMQSITDPELVLNGDFEELGDELVVNGDWYSHRGAYFQITNDLIYIENDGNTYGGIEQSFSVTSGKNFQLKYNVIEGTTGTDWRVNIGSSQGGSDLYFKGQISDFTENTIITSTSSEIWIRIFNNTPTVGDNFSIDNVSVQQVDPNDRWTLGKDWSIEGGELIHTGSPTYAFQGSLRAGDVYEAVVVVTEADATNFVMLYIGGFQDAMTSPGTYTFIVTAVSGDAINLRGSGDCRVDSISVKNITFDEEVDLARINYDSNGENGHWLLEPTSTNLVGLSEFINPSQTGWAEVATNTYTNNYSTAPDGNQNSTRVQFVNPNSSSQLFYLFNSTSGEYSASIYAKGSGTLKFGFYDNASVLTDTITLTSEWQRFEVTKTLQTTSNARFWIYPEGASAATDIEIWGAQVEALSYATSYIPTHGSTVTRATETLTGSGNSTLINSTEGVLYAEIAALADDGTQRFLGINDGSNNNRVHIFNDTSSNKIRVIVYSGGVKQVDFNYTVTDTTDFNKVAVKYKENDFALWIGGVERATDTSGSAPVGLDDLSFDVNSAAPYYGKVKALAVFDRALTDQELTDLTS